MSKPAVNKNISFNWRNAGFGAVMALIASALILKGDVTIGIGLLLGSIPAAIVGLAPDKKSRKAVLIVGLLFSVSILFGSVLALWTPLAVLGMFALGYGSAVVAAKKKFGLLALSVCLPLTATGLTYSGIPGSATVASLMAVGAIGSYIWSLLLPEFSGEVREQKLLDKAQAKTYGITLGLSAAVATAIGFALGFEFIGWLVASTMLVMRPSREMLSLRGVGRIVSVFVGATLAAWLLTLNLSLLAIAAISATALILMAATNESQWYVTPAFTSFLILWAILYEDSSRENISNIFSERVLGTIIGVLVAYITTIIMTKILEQSARRH